MSRLKYFLKDTIKKLSASVGNSDKAFTHYTVCIAEGCDLVLSTLNKQKTK